MDDVMQKFVGDSELLFVTSANMAMSQEHAILKLYSGKKEFLFAFNPLHLKRLMLLIQENVGQYEKQIGELKTDLQRPIPSPIRVDKKK